jgi:hypothetical protein
MRYRPTAKFAMAQPGLPSKENRIGSGWSQAKDLLKDSFEAHLSPGPNHIQQKGSPNISAD